MGRANIPKQLKVEWGTGTWTPWLPFLQPSWSPLCMRRYGGDSGKKGRVTSWTSAGSPQEAISMGQRDWLPSSSLAGIKSVCRIKVYCIGFEERKEWMEKQRKKQKVEEIQKWTVWEINCIIPLSWNLPYGFSQWPKERGSRVCKST